MKKVGIVSCYFKNNYGSILQAYATQRFLDNNNIPNETIRIDDNIDFKKGKRKYYTSQIFNFKFIKSKFGMIKMKVDTKINKELGKNVSIRNNKYKEFRRYFNLSRSNNTYKDLAELAEERYSDIVLGSDQLWLPVNVVADYYTLNWVPESINKISYSTSFGVSNIPKKYNDLYYKFLKRINHLSVREDSGAKLIKDITGLDAKLVSDPTILLTREEWDEVAVQERIIKDKYILCYFLGKNIEHRKFAERLREKTGYKIVSLNHADEYVKYSDKFCDIAPYDVGPKEWINLIKNAEYVCTDSFHGTVFSILYNKLFFDFRRYNSKSNVSTNSRIDSLLNVAGISNERILTGLEDVNEVLNYQINYKKVNENIELFRQDSKQWLFNSITWKDDNLKHINITSKEDCCGCTACANICPKDAIEMKADNEGFLYPVVDKEKCVDCGMCKKVCPVLNSKERTFEQKAYIGNNKNEQVRKESSSGGAFSVIAEHVLKKNGVVFGAAFDKDFNVHHTYVESTMDLTKFRGSKYVQSYLGDTYKKVKEFLENNRLTCFSGTPCQIEGLKKYLRKDYDNLITIDVMCHAVPSPLVWQKYLRFEKSKLNGKNIKLISFRDKSKYGYKYSTMTIKTDKDQYSKGVETDPYLRAFFGDLSDRPSCYACKFKKQCHESDFTIWDCFITENFDKSLDDDKGTSRVLINTNKGREIFEKIKSNFKCIEVKPEDAVKNVKEMLHSVNVNSNRKKFFEDINSLNEEEFFKKWFPDSIKVKLERFTRVIMAKTGIYSAVKKMAKKILRK